MREGADKNAGGRWCQARRCKKFHGSAAPGPRAGGRPVSGRLETVPLIRSWLARALAALCLLAAPAPGAEGGETAWARLSWTHRDGLPQDSVSAIAQDVAGFLWIGTQGGLARFDGRAFEVFDVSNREELRGNRFTSLLAEEDGGMLIVNPLDGLLRARGGRFEEVALTARQPQRAPTGDVLVATQEFLGRLTPSGVEPLLPGPTLTFVATRDGAVWRSTIARWLWRTKDGVETDYSKRGDTPTSVVFAMLESADGRLWLGGREGLWRSVDASQDRFERVPGVDGRVSALVLARDGAVWAAGALGLRRVAPGPGARVQHIDDGDFLCVFQDDRGNVWAGGRGERRGLHLYTPTPLTHIDLSQRGGAPDSWSVTAGTAGGVLVVRTKQLLELREDRVVAHEYPGAPRSAAPAEGGGWWVGSDSGLTRVAADGTVREVETGDFGGGIHAILRHRDGALWFGGRDGLARWSGDGLVARRPGEFSDVRCLLEEPGGALWVGSFEGVTRLDGDATARYARADGLSPGQVRALHRDERGVLWVGTYGGGLSRLEDGAVTRFTTEDGLADNFLAGIAEDARGRLWINSNKGPFVVNRADLDAVAAGEARQVACVLFSPEEGSVEASGGNQPSAYTDADGRIWFPTVRGVTRVDPSVLATTEAPPRLSISDFALGDDRRLVARFEALGFSSPRRVRVQYRTDGSDADWVECDGRFEAQYSYLPPGGYELQVRARNGFGPWSEVVRRRFDVPARFYESPMFLVALMALLALGGFRFASGRIRAARERAERFERLHAEAEEAKRSLDESRADLRRLSHDLLVSRDSDRRTISAELHDDVTQRLAAIAMQAELVQRKLTRDGVPAGDALRAVTDNAQQLARDVQQLSRRLHPVGLKLLGMTDAIRQECAGFERRTGTRVQLIDDVVAHEVPEDVGIAAVRIVQESLHNAEKYARAGTITVELSGEGGDLSLRVRDDGVGFDADGRASRGLGLITMRERAAAAGGELDVDSRPGGGTTITFRRAGGRSGA